MATYTALIPAAGSGVRLRPFTFTRPKPLVYVAGKPIMGHILDGLVGVVDQVTVIVGYMADKVEAYCQEAYGSHFTFEFVHQQDRLGLGHAVLQGKEAVPEGGLIITLGDEIFGMSYADMLREHHGAMPCDASVGYKIVEDPRNYGVVEVSGDGTITAMMEKPKEPTTDTAIAGAYIFERSTDLFDALQEVVDRDIRTRNEYQLTDAMVLMAESGSVFKGFLIEKWYDCGRPDMLIRVNHRLLDDLPPTNHVDENVVLDQSVIVPPVAMEGGCLIKRSVVGPYVTVGKDTEIRDSVLSDCILAEGCDVRDVVLNDTVLADRVRVHGRSHRMVVGEQTLINLD
ncbi:MAG: NTP transferase domain-containing protein [Thermoplasmata archaeon]|nr:MAG: NTP transferase domain-containing protein [Thermoplasmata archaeon]